MFHTYVTFVCSNISSPSDVYYIQVFSCRKCFMFQRYVQRVMGAWPRRPGMGRTAPRDCRWGVQHAEGCGRDGLGVDTRCVCGRTHRGKASRAMERLGRVARIYRTGGEMLPDALLGPDIRALVPPARIQTVLHII
jgi:hypothetical protein